MAAELISQEPSGYGRERQLADPAVTSILTVELPSRGMTVPVTDLPFTGGGPIVSNMCIAVAGGLIQLLPQWIGYRTLAENSS